MNKASRFISFTLGLLLVFLCSQALSFAPDWATGRLSEGKSPKVIGVAYDLKTREILYREYHFYSPDGVYHQVTYKSPEGQLWVDKTINYSAGFVGPQYYLNSYTAQDSLGIIWSGNKLQVMDKNFNKTALDIKAVSDDTPLVIDAGFDHFVKNNFSSLVAGESLSFYFPIAKRELLAKLRIANNSCSYSSGLDETPHQCFKLEVANWVLRLLVAPIELGYHRESQQLLRYRGLSNIENLQGQSQVVDIHYHYSDTDFATCGADC